MKPIRVDVEPLTEQRWARIEEGLDAKLDDLAVDEASDAAPPSREMQKRSPSRWIAGVAVAAGVVAWIGARAFSSAPALEHPTRIVTTASASHLAVGDSALDVAPSSALTVDPSTNGVVVVLERGRVECEVAPQDHKHPFVVRAGDYSVRVVGTHFAVTRGVDDAQGKTHATVDVERGTVQVSGAGTSVTLHAGDHWASPDPVTDFDTPPAPTETAAPTSQPTSAAFGGTPTTTADRPKAATQSTAQQDFETAASLEKSDPARAIATYDRLAKGTGPWAENALFAEARLENDRGNRDASKALLDRYLARYPNGTNAEDARELLRRP